jgi:hypothetical protein
MFDKSCSNDKFKNYKVDHSVVHDIELITGFGCLRNLKYMSSDALGE